MARYLDEGGFSVVVANMQAGPLPNLISSPSVFISSQHPSLSSHLFRHFWGQSPPFSNYVGPLEIQQCLQPACSVFVPHDLEEPILPNELPYMSTFDLYCAPSSAVNPGLGHFCKVVPAGWIKHNHFDDLPLQVKDLVAVKGVFFLNQVSSIIQSGGATFINERYPQLFTNGIPIKLPAWPGCKALGEELQQMGATILADDIPSTKLISASSALYVNAPGSAVAEARYVGTPAFLWDGGARHPRVLVAERDGPKTPMFDFQRLLLSIADHIETHT